MCSMQGNIVGHTSPDSKSSQALLWYQDMGIIRSCLVLWLFLEPAWDLCSVMCLRNVFGDPCYLLGIGAVSSVFSSHSKLKIQHS